MIHIDTGPLLIPTLAIGALALGGCAWLYRSVAKQVDAGPRRRIIALRAAAMSAVVIFMLNPRWADTAGKSASVAVLLDCSRSMATKDEGRERLALARSAMESAILPNLPPAAQVELLRHEDKLMPVRKLSTITADGQSSDLFRAIEEVVSLQRNRPIAGIVVVSDGAIRSDISLEAVAGFCKRKGIPVHTVAMAANAKEPTDIAVEAVECRPTFPLGRPARVQATVRSPGFASGAVPAQLKQGNKVLAEETLYLNGQSQNITLTYTPKEKGFAYLEVSIAGQRGERTEQNNRRIVGAEVVEPKIRVHYQEGTSFEEAQHLTKGLEVDPTIKVDVPQPMNKFPATMADLLEYDVFIVSDITKGTYTDQQRQNMARFVTDFGGGFIMIGGHTAFGSGGWNHTVVDRIIPVAMEKETGSDGGEFSLFIPPDALQHPIMQMFPTQVENREFWETRSPKFHGNNRTDHAKPGAHVLAVRQDVKNASGPMIIFAAQEIGRGRSLAFTTDTTVSWGSWFEREWGEQVDGKNDLRYYRKFWNNAIKWLAENRLTRSTAPVSLELSQNAAFTGDIVQITTRVQDADLNPIGDADVQVQIRGKAALKASFDEAAGVYTVAFTPDEAGDYVIESAVKRPGQEAKRLTQKLRVDAVDMELFDVRARPATLERLSSITGGVSLSADEQDLGAKIRQTIRVASAESPAGMTSLWDRWPAMVLLMAAFAGEWIVRRRNGLA